MRTIKRKINHIKMYFSVPLYIYGIILFISVVFMLLQALWACDFAKALANIGYSLIASLIAALFVDYGNNKILYKKQLKDFWQLCGNHNQLAIDLFVTVNGLYEKNYDPEMQDITFKKMIERMLDPQYRKYNITKSQYEEGVSAILNIIKQICIESKKLEKILVDHIENLYSTGYFRAHLTRIAFFAEETKKKIEQRKYGAASKIINKKLLPTIVEIYPETSEYFD